MKQSFNNLIGLNEQSKTLIFKLNPVNDTKNYLEKMKENDLLRLEKYPIVKNLIDNAYRDCINKVYSVADLDFNALYEKFESVNDFDSKDEYDKMRDKYIKELEKLIKKSDDYKNLQKSKFLKTLLGNEGLSEDERNALEAFDKFTVYFSAFYNNRENVFTTDDIPTSLFSRMLDNAHLYFKNLNMIKKIAEVNPEILIKVENNLKKPTGPCARPVG